MSTVVAWGADEGRGKLGSCYLASDSRISAGSSWDYGQKVFALKDGGILAYVGNVLFPTQILSQLIDLINRGIVYENNDCNDHKADKTLNYIIDAMHDFFQELKGTKIIIIFVREKQFDLYEINLYAKQMNKIEIEPGNPYVYGSGSKSFFESYALVRKKDHSAIYDNVLDESKLSRYIFQSLVHSVNSGKDPYSGGNIQIVGLYRNGTAQPFGFVSNYKKYLYGLEVYNTHLLSLIDWRNEKFERIKPDNMMLQEGGQIQPMHKEFLK